MKLIAILGPLKGEVLNLEDKPEWIIGRDSAQCNFVIDDTTVSRKHIRIYKSDQGYVLKNLSSTNPVEVNDERVDEYILEENDKIKIGENIFLFTALSKEDLETPLEEEILEEQKTKEEEKLLPPIEPQFSEEKIEDKEEENLLPIQEEKTSDEGHDATIFEEKEEEMPSGLLIEAAFILKIISGPNAGSEFGMDKSKSYIIGKDPTTSDIIFTDLSVSKNHTKISIDENKNIFVEDLGSKNGTYVNNAKIDQKTLVTQTDLITIGTTTFLIVEKEAAQETIYSPAPTFEEKKKEEQIEEEKKVEVEAKTSWRKQIIPINHLIYAGSFVVIFFVVFLSFFALFRAHKIDTTQKQPVGEIKKIIDKFPDVEFSYNPSSANLMLVGHILTNIQKQELLYDLNQLNFISNIEDTIIVDEGVWKDFNATLMSLGEFKSVSLHANEPGKFLVEGYVKTAEEYQKLSDYINTNFPYVNRLENRVVIDQLLQVEIATNLIKNNFPSVTFELISGELVLAGRYNEAKSKAYEDLMSAFKKTQGITSIKNLAIPSSEAMARVDLSEKYKISGVAAIDGKNISIVANGKIVTIGDQLDGMIVTLISSNSIFLEKDDILYKINYSP